MPSRECDLVRTRTKIKALWTSVCDGESVAKARIRG